MGKKLLEISDLSASFDQKIVLENINLSIFQNDFIGVIGPNGGGKTTLVKVILGLHKEFEGKVIQYPENPNSKLNIGYLPQINQIDFNFPINVLDVVLSGLMQEKTIFGKYSKEDKAKATNLLSKFGIEHLLTTNIGELSGGQRQRVFLARAIISSPHLLILDEPNTFVDNQFEEELYKILIELNKELAIVLVTHDVGTIFSYVKTMACINRFLHYHPTNEVTNEMLKAYNCPIDLVTHGTVPHRVLHDHIHDEHH